MKRIILLIFLFSSIGVFAQNLTKEDINKEFNPLNEKVKSLQLENTKFKSEIGVLNFKLSKLSSAISTLKKEIQSDIKALNKNNKELDDKIQQTGKTSEENISSVNHLLSKNSLYGIIGVLLTLLTSVLIYLLLTERQKTNMSNTENQIEETRNTLLKEGIQLDTKLANILETQLQLILKEKKEEDISEVDHALPLKVADEITRINAYINTLDPNSQDAKALKSSMKKLTNTLKVANYDIVDLLGQQLNEGLKVLVLNIIPDKTLKPGEEVISKIIKPLVKFKGEQIQAAQVDISTGN